MMRICHATMKVIEDDGSARFEDAMFSPSHRHAIHITLPTAGEPYDEQRFCTSPLFGWTVLTTLEEVIFPRIYGAIRSLCHLPTEGTCINISIVAGRPLHSIEFIGKPARQHLPMLEAIKPKVLQCCVDIVNYPTWPEKNKEEQAFMLGYINGRLGRSPDAPLTLESFYAFKAMVQDADGNSFWSKDGDNVTITTL
jgi:hypothetical protein